MSRIRRVFRGKHDPSRVTLSPVFPMSDITISTPFENEKPYQRVLIEGEQGQLDELKPYLQTLTRTVIDEKFFGSWMGFVLNDFGWELQYEHCGPQPSGIRLLAVVLRAHFARVCDLYLTEVSFLVAQVEGTVVVNTIVPLVPSVGNGSKFLKPLIPGGLA